MNEHIIYHQVYIILKLNLIYKTVTKDKFTFLVLNLNMKKEMKTTRYRFHVSEALCWV